MNNNESDNSLLLFCLFFICYKTFNHPNKKFWIIIGISNYWSFDSHFA